MLRNRLEKVILRLEPSKRIWWREEFGGCAPDREPLDSEIWDTKYGDGRNVLRTSLPPFEDQPQVTQQHQSSNDFLNNRNSSSDEAPTVRRKPQPPKSPTHYIPDKFPALHFPDPATMKASRRKPKVYTAEEDEQLLQSALRKREANNFERQRLYGIPLERVKGLPAKSSTSVSQRDQCVQAPSSIPNQVQIQVSKPEERQQVNQSPTDDYLRRFRQAWNGSPPLLAHGITHRDDQRESVSRGPSVRPKVRSPKSPTHYIPDRLPPLKFPDFSKDHPARHALRMQKKPIVEDEDQLPQADDPWPVEKIVEMMKLEKLRRQEHKQLQKSLYQKIEAMNLRRSQRRGITIHQSEKASCASSHSVAHVDSVEEELSIAEAYPASEELRQLKSSLLEKIEALRLRRRSRHGTAIHRSENASSASSYSIPHVDSVEEELSIAEAFPASKESRPMKTSLLERIEAMRLRRSRRQGTAIHRSEAYVPMDSDPSSQHVEVGEASSKIELQRRSSEASAQQVEPSLWNKVEAMKQRLSRRQGTAIYRAKEARDQNLASPSTVDQASGVLLGTQDDKQNPMLDRRLNFGVRSCQDLEALKLVRSSCRRIALSV